MRITLLVFLILGGVGYSVYAGTAQEKADEIQHCFSHSATDSARAACWTSSFKGQPPPREFAFVWEISQVHPSDPIPDDLQHTKEITIWARVQAGVDFLAKYPSGAFPIEYQAGLALTVCQSNFSWHTFLLGHYYCDPSARALISKDPSFGKPLARLNMKDGSQEVLSDEDFLTAVHDPSLRAKYIHIVNWQKDLPPEAADPSASGASGGSK